MKKLTLLFLLIAAQLAALSRIEYFQTLERLTVETGRILQ